MLGVADGDFGSPIGREAPAQRTTGLSSASHRTTPPGVVVSNWSPPLLIHPLAIAEIHRDQNRIREFRVRGDEFLPDSPAWSKVAKVAGCLIDGERVVILVAVGIPFVEDRFRVPRPAIHPDVTPIGNHRSPLLAAERSHPDLPVNAFGECKAIN
jgi:hypothetical protein